MRLVALCAATQQAGCPFRIVTWHLNRRLIVTCFRLCQTVTERVVFRRHTRQQVAGAFRHVLVNLTIIVRHVIQQFSAAGKVAHQLFAVLFQLSFIFPVRTAMPAVGVIYDYQNAWLQHQ